ncbi:hypothetical protein Acr_00g0079860 [Actinidia rufa]|uniref:Uncharacterized protein n=1 Tax=Actinidia rufa TaxID=165716 RepID=A0A7J0DU97_9ERIC|nr:hypothetical protein Acr_00g0079860 [Actinidia rufa]
MDKDEPKNDRANQTVHWTRSVPPCSTRDECLRSMDQIGEDVLGEDISEQGLIDEEACESETSERDCGGTYEELGDIGGFSQQFRAGWEVDYEYSQGCPVQRRGTEERDGHDRAKDRKMFSTYASCEGLVQMANKHDEQSCWQREQSGSAWQTGRFVTLTETGRDAVRHGSSDIRRKKNGQGKQQVHTGTQSKRRDTWRSQSGTRAQGDALRHVRKVLSDKTGATNAGCPEESPEEGDKVDSEELYIDRRDVAKTSLFRSLDLISGSDLFRCVHKGGERESHGDSQSDVLCGALR